MQYLEDGAAHFTKGTKHNNIDFNGKVVKDKDGKKNSKEVVTNSEKETSKKRHNVKQTKMQH